MVLPQHIHERQRRNTGVGPEKKRKKSPSLDDALLVMSSSGTESPDSRGRLPSSGHLSSSLKRIEDAPAVRTDALRQQASDLGSDALDAPIVRQLVSSFLESSREAVPAVIEAVENNEWNDAAKAAHRIKGGAGHVGAEALAEAGRAIEHGIEEERFDRVRRVAKVLPKTLSDAESKLRETVGSLSK